MKNSYNGSARCLPLKTHRRTVYKAKTIMLKIIIVILFILVIISLFSGAFFLIKDKGQPNSKRTLYALGFRVTSVTLLILTITYGIWTGQLRLNAPWHASIHGSNPHSTAAPNTPSTPD